MIGALVVALIASAAPPACTLATSVGHVERIDWLTRASDSPGPTVSRPGVPPVRLERVDYLCIDDIVGNPARSGRNVVIRIGGRAVRLQPGDRNHVVTAPAWWESIGPLLDDARRAFAQWDQGRHSIVETILRGPRPTPASQRCILASPGSPLDDNFVLDGQTVHLRFACAPDARQRMIEIVRDRTVVAVLPFSRDVAVIAGGDCRDRCMVRVQGTAPSLSISLTVVSGAGLEQPDRGLLLGSPMSLSLLGMRLLEQPRWAMMGGSLLRSVACRVPAAAAVSMTEFHLEETPQLCALADA